MAMQRSAISNVPLTLTPALAPTRTLTLILALDEGIHVKTDIAQSRSDECDIGFQVQFNAEFTSQVMNFS